MFLSHLHLFKYLTVPRTLNTLRYTRIGIGDPNNHSFIFQHCSSSSDPYTFHIQSKVVYKIFSNTCADKPIPLDEIENHTYTLDEPLVNDWTQYNRVMITETKNVMTNFLKSYLALQ